MSASTPYTDESIQQVLNYLALKPYGEVYLLIASLQQQWNAAHPALVAAAQGITDEAPV